MTHDRSATRPAWTRLLAAGSYPGAMLTALACCFVVAMPPLSPAAQQQGRSVVIATSPEAARGQAASLSRSDFERYGSLLELDDVQREVAAELFAEFADRRTQRRDLQRERMAAAREGAREGGDFGELYRAIRSLGEQERKASDAEQATLLADVRALLTEAQAERWPLVERRLRRDRLLSGLTRSLARVDMEDLVREAAPELAQTPEMASEIEAWALRVDKALRQREKLAADVAENAFNVGGGARLVMSVTETRGQGEDPYKPLREIDGRLEDMAGALVRVAGAMAGPEQAQAIDRAWHERAFPQVYRPTDGERRLQAALAMEGLTADQADVLAALRDEVARLADTRRAAWLAAARQAEAASTLPPGVELQVGGDGAPADPVAQARESVRAIDTRIEGGLEAVLTADQIAQLPARVPEYVQVSPWQGEAPIRFQQRGGG